MTAFAAEESRAGWFSATPDWETALKSESSPLAKKLLLWLTVTETDRTINTHELIHFALENSSWPKIYLFRDDIEKGIDAPGLHAAEIAAWFDQTPAKTAEGITAYIKALMKLDQTAKVKPALKKFWLDADLDKKETAAPQQYARLWSPTDHVDRLDNLLWEQRYNEAEAMMPLVDADSRKMAEARIGLGRLSSKAPKLVRAVPASMQKDSGFLYDRLRWRRIMNKDADAFDLLQHLPPHAKRPVSGANAISSPAAEIEKHSFARAYQIISGHGMVAGTDYSQAEWMLGWLALEFLNQPDKAYHHFENFNNAVNSAVSRSRGAYWLAQAAEKLHHRQDAQNWEKARRAIPLHFLRSALL